MSLELLGATPSLGFVSVRWIWQRKVTEETVANGLVVGELSMIHTMSSLVTLCVKGHYSNEFESSSLSSGE